MRISRTLHLRRPPVLSIQHGVFVPPVAPAMLSDAERRWEALRAANPAYFDGRLYHVLGVHRNGHGGATLHVMDCAYRYFAAQDERFDLGVRPLGIKGVTRRDGLVLTGKRSRCVASYQGLWEFAPAGSMETGREPAELVQHELLEETGLRCAGEPVAVAVLFDPVLRCWELVYELIAQAGPLRPRTGEYDDVQWRRPDDLPTDLSPVARQLAELLKTMVGRPADW